MAEVIARMPPQLLTVWRWLLQRPLRLWQQLVFALLTLWLVYGLSQLTWLLFPAAVQPVAAVPTTLVGASGSQQSRVDIARLQQLNLFGSVETGSSAEAVAAVPAPEPGIEDDAAKTSLALNLVGLVHSAVAEESRANIIASGREEQYAIGDKIPVGNQVSLAKVLLDRVIIDNNGRYEALFLYDGQDSQTAAAPQRQAATSASNLAREYRDRVYTNPSSLAEVLRIAPQTEGGQLVGYRISPGRDEEQFAQLGFQPEDVIVAVNNIPLDDPAQALEVYKIMRTAREASFAIIREGEPVDLVVSLAE